VPVAEIIIADSSPLIGLARIGQLQLLPKLARRIVVPPAVWQEITEVKQEAPGAREVTAQSWIEILTPDPAIVAPLLILAGRGEAEPIALARREPAAVLLFDDLRARKLAARLNLRRMGTVALLAAAKRAGLIEKLKPQLEALVANNIYLRQELIDAVLRDVGG
jgi:predicted nucleic acid-binding protein